MARPFLTVLTMPIEGAGRRAYRQLRGAARRVLKPDVVASEWAREFYARDAPALAPKLRVCPAGVDAEYWKPSGAPQTNRAVVYWKSGDEAFCARVEAIVKASGLEPIRLRSKHGEHA